VDDDLPRTEAPGVTRRRDPVHDVAADVAVAAQREAEFAAFYRAEIRKLVGFVMNAAGTNHHDAADAAQNALMQAWTVWDTLTNPRAWVRTVAIRQFYRSSPQRQIPTDTPPDCPVLETPDVALELSEQTKAAHRLLDILPTQQRIVFTLSREGISNKEIANELKMTEAAVRQNLHRARTALKQRLEISKEGDV
jgi:RNA polymerase sigma factor (sigma-70 family)